jgi:multidrug efflux system membrane fusion protein
MRAVYSYGIAAIIILVLGAWLATGTLVIGGKGPGKGETPIISLFEENGGPIATALEENGLAAAPEAEGEIDPHLTIAQRVAETSGEATAPQSVRTVTYQTRAMPIEVPLRGRTKAKSSVTITPETSGVVTTVNVEKGQAVTAGDLICTLDKGTREAAVAQAEAGLAQAQSQFQTNETLRQKELVAANSSLPLQAALKAAQAALDNARTELERTNVKTQVAGIIQDPLASVGNMLSPGQPCATVVELDPMLFVGTVPEARIAQARTGLPAKIETVTGQTVEGKVSYIASTADEATRSFAVEIAIPNKDGKVLSGITATATVNIGTLPAHLLPQSVLTLDDEGALGVRAVRDNVVEFYAVTIVSDSREGVWVTGLPPRVDIITVGQEFVQAGQTVDATNVTGTPAAGEAAAEGVQS